MAVPRLMFQDFKWCGEMIRRFGLLTSLTSGNMSIRQGDIIYITRHNASLTYLRYQDIIEVGIDDDKSIDKDASMELPLHREIYRCIEINAIMHVHGVYAIISSSFENTEIIPCDIEGEVMLGKIKVVKQSESMKEDIIKSLKDSSSVIVERHGIFATGKSLRDAFNIALITENSCKIVVYERILKKV